MGKIAFLFPGQGAQYLKMGKELFDNFNQVRTLFDNTNDILGEDLTSICFSGPEELLKRTENTQPAILMVSIAAMKVLMSKDILPHMAAGLSLGEYSALVAANSISYEDAIPLVRKRGIFMQQAVPLGVGTMAAVLGLSEEQVHNCCKIASDVGVVEPANYNCPGQIVISGHVAAVQKACELAKEAGAKRTLQLSVSAPFHCSLLEPAGIALQEELENIIINNPQIPVISNVEAFPVKNNEHIRHLLVKQVSSPVRWNESIRYMIEQGVNTFIELGPGKVLNGFIRKISRDIRGFNVEDMKSLEETLKGLEDLK